MAAMKDVARPLAAWLLLTAPALCGEAATRPATHTTSQVKASLAHRNSRLRVWSIEYQAATDQLPYYTHRVLAARWPDACYYQGAKGVAGFSNGEPAVGTDWRQDEFRDWLLATSRECFWGRPGALEFGSFALRDDESLPYKMANDLMFLATGWWPFESRPGPQLEGGLSYVIPAVAASDRYIVAPSQEQRSGRWCHVLEAAGHERIWIDVERGGLITGREFYDRTTQSVVQTLDMSDHREVAPGVWVPYKIHNRYRVPNPSAAAHDPRTIDSWITIVDVRIDDSVDSHLFQPPALPPGSLIVDQGGAYRQANPGGYDYMDDLARRVRATSRFGEGGLTRQAATDYLVIVASVAGIAVVYLTRRLHASTWLGFRVLSTSKRGFSGGTIAPADVPNSTK